MAEDNVGFSPLDPLGPEYGKINQPSLDQRGLSPFEGDRITQKPINFPEPKAFPVMPGINLDKPQRNVRQTVVGSPDNPVNKNATLQDRVNATRDYLSAKIKAGQSKDAFAKIYSYDAGPDSNAFYKRYQAYGQEKFDQIGFSPLRDNEALFNSRTTVMDDFNRMLTHSFVPLFTRGFVSGPKSLMKMLQGDFTSSDLEDARAYEEAAAIGQSSKGGFSGFLNNTLMNFGYTAGIIGEAVVEEVGGALLAAPTGGASLFATTYNNLRKIKTLGAVTDAMKAVGSTLKNLNNLQFARNFWNASKSISASKVGRFFNPLENTFDAIGDLRKLSKTDNITGLAATYKTAGGFYRDVRNLNMAISEARLEAGMVENKRYDEDYRKLYELNKRAPTNEEQRMLEKNAKDAASDTFYWNAGLIYATNKITFDNITGPRGGLRNFIKNTIDDVYTVGGGKFGNIGKIVYDNAAKKFSFEANNLKNLAKSWYKQPGIKTLGKTVGYLKANLTEGIQENFQEVIARTNEKYYAQSFDSKLRQAHEYGKAVGRYSYDSQSKIFKEELGKEFTSAQGFETFASGFFMGIFAQPLNASIPFLSTNYNRIFKKEEFAKYKAEKEKIKNDLVNKLNSIDIKEFVKSKAFNLGVQDVLANVRQTGSKKEAIDAELEGMVESVQTMLDTNTLDLFVDNLKNINQMDDAEFMDTIKDVSEADVPKYRERVAQTITKLNRIQDRFNYYKDKMPNPISEERLSRLTPGSQDFIDAVTLKAGWDMSVKNAVFYNEAFEDTMSRMKGIYDKFMSNTTLKKFGQTELGLLFDQDKLSNEIVFQRKEIKAIEDLADQTPEAKAELKKKKEYLKNLESVRDSYTSFDEFYNRQDYYELVRESLKKELGRDVTDEEVLAKAESIVGKESDEKRQTKVLGDLQKSIYDYIRHVADVNKDFVFDDNLDKGFELLLDHYKLGQEGRMLVNYINLLHNPGSFFEAAQRNQQWMKDMYNRRSEYYENLVKKQMDEVENNALLNALADKGIFINLEDLQDWLDNGVAPKEFFNNVTKEVIPQDSQEYLEAMLILQQKKELQESEQLSEEEIMNAIGKGITNAGEARVSYSDSQIKELATKLENDEEGNLILPGKAFKEVFGPTLKNKRAIALSNSVNQELLRLVKKEGEAPVTETPVSNIEAKKADIEKRRKEALAAVKTNSDSRSFEGWYDYFTEHPDFPELKGRKHMTAYGLEIEGKPYDSLSEYINIKYDAEIDALEGKEKPKPTVSASVTDLVTPQSIQEVEEALKALYEKNLVVNPEDSNTYIEVDEAGVRIPGTPVYDRVSTLKGPFDGPKDAANRGTIIDDLLRDFIDGSISTVDDLKAGYERNPLKSKAPKFSDGFLNELFAIFSEVKSTTEERGLKLTSRIPTLWGKIKGKDVAGTIDVLAIDKDGNVYIIDLKTATRNRRDVNDNLYQTYRKNDSIQQSAYAEMIRQRTGITVKNIVIFPVQVMSNKQGTLVSAVANKEGDKFTMAVQIDRDIFPEISGAVPEEEAGIVVGTDLSEAAKAKLEKLGFTKDMINVMSKDEIELAKTLQPETASELRDTVIQRLRDQGIYVPYITRFTLKKDQNLISQMSLVINDENNQEVIFASTGDTVVVNSINAKDGTAVLQKLGSNIKGNFTIADMDKMFKLEEMGIKSEPVDIENKDEATSFTETGNDVTDAFIENRDTRAAIESAIEESYNPENPNSIVDQAEKDLLDDTDC